MTPADEALLRSRSYELWLDVRAPMDSVFDRIATAAGLRSWWVEDATLVGDPPSQLRLVWGQGAQAMVGEMRILAYARPEVLECEWSSGGGRPVVADGSNFRGSRVPIVQRFELTDVTSTMTRLHLRDSGFGAEAAFDGIYRASIEGWDRSLANLISVCETGKDLRQPAASG